MLPAESGNESLLAGAEAVAAGEAAVVALGSVAVPSVLLDPPESNRLTWPPRARRRFLCYCACRASAPIKWPPPGMMTMRWEGPLGAGALGGALPPLAR